MANQDPARDGENLRGEKGSLNLEFSRMPRPVGLGGGEGGNEGLRKTAAVRGLVGRGHRGRKELGPSLERRASPTFAVGERIGELSLIRGRHGTKLHPQRRSRKRLPTIPSGSDSSSATSRRFLGKKRGEPEKTGRKGPPVQVRRGA